MFDNLLLSPSLVAHVGSSQQLISFRGSFVGIGVLFKYIFMFVLPYYSISLGTQSFSWTRRLLMNHRVLDVQQSSPFPFLSVQAIILKQFGLFEVLGGGKGLRPRYILLKIVYVQCQLLYCVIPFCTCPLLGRAGT